MKYTLQLILTLLITVGYAQDSKPNKILDSLLGLVLEKPRYVLKTIDSIENTFDSKFLFNKGLYYKAKGQAYLTLNDNENFYNNYAKGINYAKQTKDYNLIADFSLTLSDAYAALGDFEKSYYYIDLALQNYIIKNNKVGIIEAKQYQAYNLNEEGFFQKSNDILLKTELLYKTLKDKSIVVVGYFHIFSNYLHLNNKPKANEYLNKLKNIKSYSQPKNTKDLEQTNLIYYLNISNYDLAEFFLKSKKIDSTLHYLSKVKLYTNDLYLKEELFKMYADCYNYNQNHEKYKIYSDSLVALQKEQSLKQLIKNTVLIDKNLDLYSKVRNVHNSNSYLIRLGIGLTILILSLFIFILRYRKKQKQKNNAFIKNIEEHKNKLKNQGKISLKLKIKEKVLTEIKNELKDISKTNDTVSRRQKSKNLYIKVNQETIQTKHTGSYEELYQINTNFFEKLAANYPKLNQSELLLCYYVFNQLKNTEIAPILNSSVRAVESKRYRIGVKMDIKNKKIALLKAINQSIL